MAVPCLAMLETAVTLCRAPAFLLLLIFLVSPTTVGTRATHTRPSSPEKAIIRLEGRSGVTWHDSSGACAGWYTATTTKRGGTGPFGSDRPACRTVPSSQVSRNWSPSTQDIAVMPLWEDGPSNTGVKTSRMSHTTTRPSSPATATVLRSAPSSASATSPAGGNAMLRIGNALPIIVASGSRRRPSPQSGLQRSTTTCPPQQPTASRSKGAIGSQDTQLGMQSIISPRSAASVGSGRRTSGPAVASTVPASGTP
mmetsp:Transcript_27587/g.69537  ORF Transcript_27587/g.69537 Transcript_27587/m.69537 type:complete len:254 (+) Transcript_27587:624-1385(+)